MQKQAFKKTIKYTGVATYGCIKCLHMDKATYPEELLVVRNCVQIDFVCYCKICINEVVVWLWSL